jgi:hypothetical protein
MNRVVEEGRNREGENSLKIGYEGYKSERQHRNN